MPTAATAMSADPTAADPHRSVPVREAAAPRWTREIGAGAAGALTTLAPVLTLGLLAYAALGSNAAAIGIPASFTATVLGGLLFALLSRGPMPALNPSSAPVLMLATLVAGVVADPAFHRGQPADIASLLALTAAAVAGMGVLQIAFGLAGLTRVAKFVPHPVLAGFMNGVAVVFVMSQVPSLLGWPTRAWASEGLGALARTQPATLLLGLTTVACIWAWPQIGRRLGMAWLERVVPPPFVGLFVGCAAYALVQGLTPPVALSGLIGEVPRAWPSLDRLGPWLSGESAVLLRDHLGTAALTALLMALIGSLDIVLNGLALDQALHTRTDPRRELLALGSANLLAGVLGGLPLSLSRSRALATWQAGGRSVAALAAGNTVFALLALAGGPLIALLPKVVLAGIMVMVGMLLFDTWSVRLALQWLRGQRSAEARLNLGLVSIVCAMSVVFGFAIGVATGALLAVALFIGSMNRSLLRARRNAAQQPSRRIYAPAHEALLRGLRPTIVILELEGALFFGSADRLTREVDALGTSEPGTEGAGRACRAVVMDVRRVSVIDASGAVMLAQIQSRLRRRGVALMLAGVAPDDRHGRVLTEFAGADLPHDTWYPDVDRAVEGAELLALADTGTVAVGIAVPLQNSMLMTGLDPAQRSALAELLEHRHLQAGERLFAQGDPGDRLYVLTEGLISVVGAEPFGPGLTQAASSRRRYVTCPPGMMLGEIAMLDGGGRSAEAVADIESEVYSLSRAALKQLGLDQPLLCALVYRNIALNLAERLRVASIVQTASLN